jgi:RimJ/RimL family protein N-acetyltransferase
MVQRNQYNQSVGPPIDEWKAPPLPSRTVLSGHHCRLEPLNPDVHAKGLSEAWMSGVEERDWTYLPFGPFDRVEDALEWVHRTSGQNDLLYYVIVDPASGTPSGVASFMRMDASNGCIEIGGILYSRSLSRSIAATEAMYLLLKQVFDIGYRRCEWKCDSLNAPSRRAALRLGFSFEGIFRQATIYKGRSRDTAWYAITDRDWDSLHDIFLQWLHADNFDANGRQKVSLSALTKPYLKVLSPDGALSGHQRPAPVECP